MKDWGFLLPMASAILTVLYPDEFTVYGSRACGELQASNKGIFHNLANWTNFEHTWDGYQRFKKAVEEAAPADLSLRDKDRYLWGRAFFRQLKRDAEAGFPKGGAPAESEPDRGRSR